MIAQHLYPLKGTPKPLVYRTLLGSICGMTVSFVSIYFLRLASWVFLFGVAVTAIVSFTLFCPLLLQKRRHKTYYRPKVEKISGYVEVVMAAHSSCSWLCIALFFFAYYNESLSSILGRYWIVFKWIYDGRLYYYYYHFVSRCTGSAVAKNLSG